MGWLSFTVLGSGQKMKRESVTIRGLEWPCPLATTPLLELGIWPRVGPWLDASAAGAEARSTSS